VVRGKEREFIKGKDVLKRKSALGCFTFKTGPLRQRTSSFEHFLIYSDSRNLSGSRKHTRI